MHIPDGFLDPKISTGLLGAAMAVLALCVAKVKVAITELQPQAVLAAVGSRASRVIGQGGRVLSPLVSKMGLLMSLIIIAQLFNFPVVNGTTGHLIGSVLAVVLAGPFAGTLVMVMVLAAQAMFLGDGGLIALGANIINMAVLGGLVSYYAYYLLQKRLSEWLAIGFASWLSVVMMASAGAFELAASGTNPFAVVLPAVLGAHVVIGVAEALLTIALVNLFRLLPLFAKIKE